MDIFAFADRAVDAAIAHGASYADCRLVRTRAQRLTATDARLAGCHDTESWGFSVRVLVDGAWGFASSDRVEGEEANRVAADSVAVGHHAAKLRQAPVELVPEPVREEHFAGPCEIDPFSVSLADKAGLLLQINDRLLQPELVVRADSTMFCERRQRWLVTSEGHRLSSDVFTTAAQYTATAVGHGDSRTRTFRPPARTAGYENVDADLLLNNTERVARQAVEKLTGRPIEPGVTDLVLDPHHLALTMHESIGHATELDRALGLEESLAGTSFATPDLLNELQYGSPLVNVIADNTLEGGMATLGFDDEGVAGQSWHLIREGLFVGYGTSRENAAVIGLSRSRGSCRADSFASIPIIRQNNFYLKPGPEPLTPEELIADTKSGIYIEGMGSFSIDQKRLNFQFGGDAFWEIRDGKLGAMLKNVTYQAITPEFWGSCDAICDERFFRLESVMNCGKGDPGQVGRMSHGSAPARFRQVKVGAATA